MICVLYVRTCDGWSNAQTKLKKKRKKNGVKCTKYKHYRAISQFKKKNAAKKIKHKKKDNPPIEFGPSLPTNYKCLDTCVFYFNIDGSFNDSSNIYLVVFANDYIDAGKPNNAFLILKNNEWIEEFPNKNQLIFPKQNCKFIQFGCDFMVRNLFIFQCVFVKITCENAKMRKCKNKMKNKQRKPKQTKKQNNKIKRTKSGMKRRIKL